jgi:hypothetical protein
MTCIPIASSKIIGKRLVLSSHKQLKFQHSETKRIEQRPLVTRAYNCIGGDFFGMANSFAHE